MAKDAAGPSKTWLTQEAFDRLSAELAHLSVAGREEVVAKIAAAREEGDLKENGGYHAARSICRFKSSQPWITSHH
jgi:transcription elongation factor GreA